MASKSTNFFTRIKENVMGTKEENRLAQERLDTAAKRKKEREREKAEAEEKTKMAKGGSVKGFKPCAGCPSPAKCKAAGKCLKAKMAKGGSASKKPVLAIMIGVGKPMAEKKPAAKKKAK
jgi:hypothetical protein